MESLGGGWQTLMSDGDSMRVPAALFSPAFPSNYDGPANFGKMLRMAFANVGSAVHQCRR